MNTHRGWLSTNVDMAEMRDAVMTPVIAGASTDDLARSRMAVPARVRLGPDRLEWIPAADADGDDWRWWREGEPASGALWAFIKLATEPDGERFVDFARRFGVLGLTSAGRPGVTPQVRGLSSTDQVMKPWHGCAVSWEPIPAWRAYAANAKAIVYLATALRRGERINAGKIIEEAGLESDPTGLSFPSPTWGDELTQSDYLHTMILRRPAHLAYNLDRPDHDHQSQRQWLAWWTTDNWIAPSALIPTIVWDSDRPQLCLPIGRALAGTHEYYWPPNMLFNILAAHLAAFICSGEPVGRCSRCGELHPRTRAPRADQPTYCDDCRPIAERQRKSKHAAQRRARERAVS